MTRLASKIFYLLSILIIIYSCNPSTNDKSQIERKTDDSAIAKYDSLTAKKFGADNYGMKQYVMAFLKRGPNRNLDSAEAVKLQRAHLRNIDKMADDGKLVLAGPFLDDGELRGIYIFNVETVSEAEELTKSDPAIKAGSLIMELKPWYGSAALMAINDIHKTLTKQNIAEE